MEKILIYGAGSIGKSVCGVCFNRAGEEIAFADVDRASIDDLKARNGYRVYTGDDEYEEINEVKAFMSDETPGIIPGITAVCTAVGERGLEPVLRTVAAGLKARPPEAPPLLILLCENIPHVYSRAYSLMKELARPDSFRIAECSVERMTKPRFSSDITRDVLAEPFIPLIINKAHSGAPYFLPSHTDLFPLTHRFYTSYPRKFSTNNMGHAVLGYLGWQKGIKYLYEACTDRDISRILDSCLEAAGKMLAARYGFTAAEMKDHIVLLKKRYANPALADETLRVIRSPLRKLSEDERITGVIKNCVRAGIDPSPLYPVASAALAFRCEDDPESVRLAEMLAEKGSTAVVTEVCSLSDMPETAEKIAALYDSERN